jgi:hypothetical protein
MKITLLLSLLIITHLAFSQDKFEKESRITIDDVPKNAKAFVFKLTPSKKVKWYLEEGLTEQSIEAKTKYNSKRYSIEFDTLGQLQDVEIVLHYKQLSDSLKDAINTHLKSVFRKFKIKKIQIQYSGKPEAILTALKDGNIKERNIITKYELIVKGKTDVSKDLYEFTYNSDGVFEKSLKIILKNTDHLEF